MPIKFISIALIVFLTYGNCFANQRCNHAASQCLDQCSLESGIYPESDNQRCQLNCEHRSAVCLENSLLPSNDYYD